MDEQCHPCGLTLGAQQLQDHDESGDAGDAEEKEHFQQVCRSYQQYATFHQTRQQGVNHRMYQVLNSSQRNERESSNDTGKICGELGLPTIESILPPSLLPNTSENQTYQKQFCDATIRNQFFLDNILKYSGAMTSQQFLRQSRERSNGNAFEGGSNDAVEWATEDQMSKIDSVLKSVARDWSREGREERSVAYDRLLGALARHMPSAGERDDGGDGTRAESTPPRVAVPGSGLGRLAWEIYSGGYSVQGSDFSLPMLLASDFILNGCGIPDEAAASFSQFNISPWLSETKNTASFAHRTRAVVVPDVDPTSIQHNGGSTNEASAPEFTMMAGEFLSLYSHFLPDRSRNDNSRHSHVSPKFHAVVCSFFLDTAPSLPHYLLTIYHMLEEGGLLLHFGPLMYHWSGHGSLLPGDRNAHLHRKRNQHLDDRYLSSMDYTWEEFRCMVLQCGFEILEEEMYIPARYTADSKSLMKVVYDCTFLVARKKKRLDEEQEP